MDVVIADGFSGNIFLKTMEGLGKMLKNSMKEMIDNLGIKKIALLPIKKEFKEFLGNYDYTKKGGGIFLGVDGLVIKAHGSSNSDSYYYTLKQAEEFAKKDIVKRIKEKIEK